MGNAVNANIVVEGTDLLIRVDLTQDNGFSGSGKTKVIGSTGGFKFFDLDDGKQVMVNLNVCKKP